MIILGGYWIIVQIMGHEGDTGRLLFLFLSPTLPVYAKNLFYTSNTLPLSCFEVIISSVARNNWIIAKVV
jgi:hypothetical protein